MTLVGVLDYGVGNVASILNMLHHVGAAATKVTDPAAIADVDRVILPGVGHFDHATAQLKSTGFHDRLRDWSSCDKPLLGICLGMQLLLDGSEEGDSPGLGLIPGHVRRLTGGSRDEAVKIPHMGWNTVEAADPTNEFGNQPEGSRYYFVHSFRAQVDAPHALGWTRHGERFPSAISDGRLIKGYQFHPEKSHRYGMRLLRSFATEAVPC